MKQLPQTLGNNRPILGLLLASVLLVAAPHLHNLAPQVMAYFAALLAWRAASVYWRLPLPKAPLLLGLTLLGLAVVWGHYHRIWGQEAGSSLFIVGLGLKLMELKTQRDAYLLIFLAFFVALTQYLFSQSIPMAAYTLAVVVVLVATMIALNSDRLFPLAAQFKLAGLLVLQALPLMVLLFMFFPRLSGPLWQLPDDRQISKTGLSDTITPGSISELALSQETAFRVEFDGEPPPPQLRYWRGPVFSETDGKTWSMSNPHRLKPGNRPLFSGETYAYTVTLEPHDKRWVFALDLPQVFPPEYTETSEYQLLSADEINERTQYAIRSSTAYRTGALSPHEAQRTLRLPAMPLVRMRQLVESWQTDNPAPDQLVQRALRYFHEQPFYYTLKPPLADSEAFLFETRQGFCEHYATTLVLLMRLGGVPARVVTGYQGGQWNSVGRFLEVKQADAHAWAEVWLAASGWTRVDPTAAVAPERIERGVDSRSQTAAGEIRFNPGGLGFNQGFSMARTWLRLQMFADSVDHAWNSWVLAYGADSQSQFLRVLGLVDWRAAMLGLGAGLAVLTAAVAVWVLRKQRGTDDPVQQAYAVLLRKLAPLGLAPRTGEGAFSFAERVAGQVPELADAVRRITRLYLRIRYEPNHTADDVRRLRRGVRELSTKLSTGQRAARRAVDN